MPRLYFGSRGGVYYKRKGRKVYVTNSFGSNELPKIKRGLETVNRGEKVYTVQMQKDNSNSYYEGVLFSDWYVDEIINKVPFDTLSNPKVMIQWIRENCIYPLDFMTEDFWENIVDSHFAKDGSLSFDDFINSEKLQEPKSKDGKIYWFLLSTIFTYLIDTPEQERDNNFDYIIEKIEECLSNAIEDKEEGWKIKKAENILKRYTKIRSLFKTMFNKIEQDLVLAGLISEAVDE